MHHRYPVILLCVATSVASCRSQKQATSSPKEVPTVSESSPTLPIVGCYKLTGDRLRENSPYQTADRVCLKHTPGNRSGAYAFLFHAADQLLNNFGVDLAEAQPRCPNCYAFEGAGGTINFNGDQADAMTLVVKERGGKDYFNIEKEAL